MTSIRKTLAPLAMALALGLSGHANAEAASLRYVLQADPAIPSTTTRQQQDEVMGLMSAYLELWQSPDASRYPYENLITEDAVFEYPYANSESGRRIEGRAAVAEALRELPLKATDWQFGDFKLFQTPHADIFFVEYTAKAYVPASKQTYQQRYLARVTVREGKIAGYYEVWDRTANAAVLSSAAHR
jgi:ketosteroid isomerase-like protein